MKNIALLLVLLCTTFTYAQNVATISGKIAASDGSAVPYANVYLENTTKGTSANENGEYTLTNVQFGDYVIIASAVGFKTQKITLSIAKNSVPNINFSLALDTFL